jgi:hypothetical protein
MICLSERVAFELPVTPLRRDIREALNAEWAAGIDFDSRILLSRLQLGRGTGFNPGHPALIVGRRRNPTRNTFEYLIRNNDNIESSRYRKRLNQNCESHHIWLGASEIKAVLTGTIWLRSSRSVEQP